MTPEDSQPGFFAQHAEKIRFLVVGGANTLLSIALYNAALWLAAPAAQAAQGSSAGWIAWVGANYYLIVFWLTWVMAVVVSTTTMKYFAFRSPGPLAPQVLKGYAIYLPAQALSTGILWAAVQLLGLSPRAGQIVAMVVTTIFSYLGHKYFTFRGPVEVDEALEPHEGVHVGESE